MPCRGALSIAALALVALAHDPAAAAPAVAGRQLQQNQNGQPAYCDGITRTNFDGVSDVDHNLATGGGLTYHNVARLQDGTPVNLVVTNSTPYYAPQRTNPSTTGMNSVNVGQIGLSLDPFQRPQGECFNFRYENGNTNQPVDIGSTILTFLDADNFNDNCREVYRICDSNIEFLTTQNTGLTRSTGGLEGSDSCTDLSSSRPNVNDPTNTHSMTSDQTAAGFGVRFTNTMTVCMRLDGDSCDGTDRQFMFGGLSNIDNCPLTSSSTSSSGTSGSTNGATNGGTSGSTGGATSGGSSFGGGAAPGGGSTGTGGTGSGPGASSGSGTGTGSAPSACGSTCTYAGRTSTCGDLVRNVQSNGAGGSSHSMQAAPVACANAWAVVADTCNACRDCSRNYVCQGLFEVGPEVRPRAAPGLRAAAFAAAGLAACLAAAAAVLGLARAQRPALAATAEGPAEAGPAQPLVDGLSA